MTIVTVAEKHLGHPWSAVASGLIKTWVDDITTKANAIVAGSAGFLTADAAGRAVFADSFWTEAAVTSKFVAASITTAILKAGVLSADVTGRALMATGYFTEAKATDAFAASSIVGSLLKAAQLVGTHLATVADSNVIGGVPVLHVIPVADGATGDVDVTLTHKTRIADVVVVKTAGAGGASDTITVKNVSTAITDAMSINVADKAVVRCGTIDDAQQDVAAGTVLRVTRTKASAANVACIVYVRGFRVA